MRSTRIVIVDDDDGVRDSTCLLLEARGYATSAYVSADDFWNKTAGLGGDCLLFDIHMPGMSGVDLVERLRARNIETPVILMTASTVSLGELPPQAGAMTVLRKPFVGDVLLHWIEQACGTRPPRP